jgi:hypothetical protein
LLVGATGCNYTISTISSTLPVSATGSNSTISFISSTLLVGETVRIFPQACVALAFILLAVSTPRTLLVNVCV